MSIFSFFSKKEEGTFRAASIVVRCSGLSPLYYDRATKAIEKTGIKGVMEMMPGGKIKLDLQGPPSTIEKLLADTERSLFGRACESELVWKPLTTKSRVFAALPYVAAKTLPANEKKL